MSQRTKEILVATDFSEGSDQALAAAIDLAKQAGVAERIVQRAGCPVLTVPFSSKAA